VKKRSIGLHYGVAAGLLMIAFLIRSALAPLLDNHSPFLFFLPAAMLASLFGGLLPGLAVLIAGMIIGDVFFLKPAIGFGRYTLTELTALVSYLLTGAIAVGLIEWFRRTRIRLYRTEAHEKSLEAQVAQRTASLEQSLKSLEGVLYHVAHDLRAPLRAMHSFSRLLIENASSSLDITAIDYARRIAEASLKMDVLVRDLLNYGRLGHHDVRLSSLDLWPLVESITAELNSGIQSRRAEIRVDAPSPKVRGDAQILTAVLKNLIENAVKFIPSGTVPRIHIWSEVRERAVRVCIQDNGIGIAAAYHERIFGVFERGPSSAHYPGTGIGLAIVQKGIERLGGRVGVQSNVGEGSCFWFDLEPAPQATKELNATSIPEVESLRTMLAHLRSTLCLTQ
jgi:signal transduction histidine kinase